MQKIKMLRGVTLTFKEGCKRYSENCRQRNLREGTINHYTAPRDFKMCDENELIFTIIG